MECLEPLPEGILPLAGHSVSATAPVLTINSVSAINSPSSKLKLTWPQFSHTIRSRPAERSTMTCSCSQGIPKNLGKFTLTLSASMSLFVTS